MDPATDAESFNTVNWSPSEFYRAQPCRTPAGPMLTPLYAVGTLQCYQDHKEFCENVRRDTGEHALAMSLFFRQVSLHKQEEMLRQQIRDHSTALERLAQDLGKVHGQILDNHMVLLRVSGYPKDHPAPATSSSTAKATH